MNIFINRLHSRREMLVAFNIAKAKTCSLHLFDLINIYDVCSTLPPYIVLSDTDYNDVFCKKFINDLIDRKIDIKNTKIIFLQSTIDIPKHNNIIVIPKSSFCHYNEYISLDTTEQKYILVELNCLKKSLNNVIVPITYPINKTIPIKLVNCPNFDHPQNLGIVSDIDMLHLISQCKLFIGLNDNYIYDAINMGKPVLTTEQNPILPITTEISMDKIEEYFVVDQIVLEKLKQNRISNITKYIIK